MKLSKIYNILDEISPFSMQESWDNSGLILGDLDSEISNIVLSIDVDENLINSLEKNTLLITHHPLIFKGLKQLDYNKYPTNLLHKMIEKNISNIAMHTNFDLTDLNRYVVSEVLKLKIVKEDDFILYADVDEDFDTFAKKISTNLELKSTKVVKTKDFIKRVAITTGSGCSLINSVEADCFLTGDIKYHDAMEAKSIDLSLIDIGHFESEHFFAQILLNRLKNLGLKAIISSSENPFTYI